jgi:hypothetical protein
MVLGGLRLMKSFDNLIEHKNIIHFIKAQRLRFLGHAEGMPEERDVKTTYTTYTYT